MSKNFMLSSSTFPESKEEALTATQYDSIAATFSTVVAVNNQDSNAAYFNCFDASLEGKFVLDLGSGSGYDLTEMKKRGAVIFGLDASEKMVGISQQALPDGTIKVGYFDKIPFPDSYFDFVISKWALQTAYRIDPIYEEVSRVLKTNGQIIFLICHPMRQFIEKKHDGKNYYQQQVVESTFFEGQITVREPSHRLDEYLSSTFFKRFSLFAFEEGTDSGAEKINGDVYPSFFIIKACQR